MPGFGDVVVARGPNVRSGPPNRHDSCANQHRSGSASVRLCAGHASQTRHTIGAPQSQRSSTAAPLLAALALAPGVPAPPTADPVGRLHHLAHGVRWRRRQRPSFAVANLPEHFVDLCFAGFEGHGSMLRQISGPINGPGVRAYRAPSTRSEDVRAEGRLSRFARSTTPHRRGTDRADRSESRARGPSLFESRSRLLYTRPPMNPACSRANSSDGRTRTSFVRAKQTL